MTDDNDVGKAEALRARYGTDDNKHCLENEHKRKKIVALSSSDGEPYEYYYQPDDADLEHEREWLRNGGWDARFAAMKYFANNWPPNWWGIQGDEDTRCVLVFPAAGEVRIKGTCATDPDKVDLTVEVGFEDWRDEPHEWITIYQHNNVPANSLADAAHHQSAAGGCDLRECNGG